MREEQCHLQKKYSFVCLCEEKNKNVWIETGIRFARDLWYLTYDIINEIFLKVL